MKIEYQSEGFAKRWKKFRVYVEYTNQAGSRSVMISKATNWAKAKRMRDEYRGMGYKSWTEIAK